MDSAAEGTARRVAGALRLTAACVVPMPHLFVNISSHGFGHLAQVAPILNELTQRLPDLRLMIRSAVPAAKLRARINGDFTHLAQASDFGYAMLDAVRIDFAATAAKYRAQHANWTQRVAGEAAQLAKLRPDLVLTDVAYLPLAGAARAGIPSLTMCSLNWADLFAHYFGREDWAPAIHRQMLAAYRGAESFLRLTPAMLMADFPNRQAVAPVAALGTDRGAELRGRLCVAPRTTLGLVAFGGFAKDLDVERWPAVPGLHWLIPENWPCRRADMAATEPLGIPFPDLLRSVDVVLTKPGYGTFTEAACNGAAVLYLRRDDWPEQDCLIEWLHANARCLEVEERDLASPRLAELVGRLLRQPAPPTPIASGAAEAAELIARRLAAI
ncbi:MAG: hypothetical protein QM739_05680 [Propionivibrio sp.]